MQASAFPPQPAARRLVLGTDRPDHAPEGAGVVHVPEMRDLVGGDIVEHAWRRHDQAPREHEIALHGARSPAGTRILERQLPELLADRARVPFRCSNQPLSRQLLQKRHHCRGGGSFRSLDGTFGKSRGRPRPSHDHVRLAFDRNLGAEIDRYRTGPALDSARDPIGLLRCKVLRNAQTHACRQRQCHATVQVRHPQAQSSSARRLPNVDPDTRHGIQPHAAHCPLPFRSLAHCPALACLARLDRTTRVRRSMSGQRWHGSGSAMELQSVECAACPASHMPLLFALQVQVTVSGVPANQGFTERLRGGLKPRESSWACGNRQCATNSGAPCRNRTSTTVWPAAHAQTGSSWSGRQSVMTSADSAPYAPRPVAPTPARIDRPRRLGGHCARPLASCTLACRRHGADVHSGRMRAHSCVRNRTAGDAQCGAPATSKANCIVLDLSRICAINMHLALASCRNAASKGFGTK